MFRKFRKIPMKRLVMKNLATPQLFSLEKQKKQSKKTKQNVITNSGGIIVYTSAYTCVGVSCKIFKNTFFTEHLRVTSSENACQYLKGSSKYIYSHLWKTNNLSCSRLNALTTNVSHHIETYQKVSYIKNHTSCALF